MTRPIEGRDAVLGTSQLGFVWDTDDPFLFCVHHQDAYPPGNDAMGPAASLEGRRLGQDFTVKDGFRMYHGDVVPGFPQHPHRGFETVTVVREGLLDHADSMGAAARYGGGDTQWLTAGRGILHAEMFPLRNQEAGNPLELFQIWLNLPAKNKMVEPHFTMLWRESIPVVTVPDVLGRPGSTRVTVVAGVFNDAHAPAPPPSSWATDPAADVAIWPLRMSANTRIDLPPAAAGTHRSLYFFIGDELRVGGVPLAAQHRARARADMSLTLESGASDVELLVLQGRPIGEPVAQHGPFVMNTQDEVRQAYSDYRRTRFGGWPWDSQGPVHAREQERFARFSDGTTTKPEPG